ncbi:MAG TPA: aminotransferase class I/II-fold pyridoxal phosphate-dependent enzyme [Pyrinomonadaceae bacterium]|nr:aminotransferase class I/II-fold pyridoxal phosphate-dependent enzyme [Pyrinomonadaceae bacterium]
MLSDDAPGPLVSCVMPTADRRHLVPRAIGYFLAQDYPNRELVVVDDGRESVADLIPDDPRVRYARLEGRRTLGEKRNECVRLSRGDLIMHWDDDDWMAPRRISYQVEALMGAGAEVCGLTRMLFYDPAADRLWLYEYPEGNRPWLAGGSLLYTRDFWRRAPFPDIQVASDTRFIYGQQLLRSVALEDHTFYVALIHPGNTSPKRRSGSYWKPCPDRLESFVGADAEFYRALARPRAADAGAQPARAAVTTEAKADARAAQAPPEEKMRIGYVLQNFPALSETFIRREVAELCRAGHRVFVYTIFRHHDPLVREPAEPRLTVREIDFRRHPEALAAAVREDNVEHLHSSLMFLAQRAAYETARSLQIPFTLTVYSGHDVFTASDPRLYSDISADPFCERLVVEDEFMRDWVTQNLGALPEKVTVIPNSFDTELYKLAEPRRRRDGEALRVLAVARFVEKKGFVHLVRAFRKVAERREDVELWLVGRGPEEARLRAAAGEHPRIRFLGAVPEEETRRLYAEADLFCAPCVRTATRDADGVPTTALEAMAYELPVVASELLSTPHYVRDGVEGLLTQPGDEAALASALERLCADADLRERLGRAGRSRVVELCDIRRNVGRLEEIFAGGRRRRWRECIDALVELRRGYTPEREVYYDECRRQAVGFFKPGPGRLLDIGCGSGRMRAHMPEGMTYVGCDPVVTDPPQAGFEFVRACGEALPFAPQSFDAVLLNCVLLNVYSVGRVLAEAARVLKPGGQLFMRECVNDPNPIHLNHFTPASLLRAVGEHFVQMETGDGGRDMMLLKARKSAGAFAPASVAARRAQPPAPTAQRPLVSIAITSYNREHFLRAAIDSVLAQSYQPLEVVVVDDGSTDATPALLESYGSRIRAARNERNRGIAHAKNRALRLTSPGARYVGLLDSDDYYHPRFVERCVEFLEGHKEAGLVYVDDTLVDEHGRELRRQPAVAPWSVEAWLRTCNLRGDTWLARRELVMQTALHDESLSHDVDYDLFYQLLELTTFAHLPEFLAYIRQHGARATANQADLAKCHAANLVKYGYSPEYAYRRARQRPEWLPAVEEGIALGRLLRERRGQQKQKGGRVASNGSRPAAPNGAGAAAASGEEKGTAHAAGSNGAAVEVVEVIETAVTVEAKAEALALDGGDPVRSSLLPFGAPCLGEEEAEEILDTLRSGWIGTGPKARRFEEEFAEYVGARHAVALNSCTAGLFLSLVALGIGPGDEVVTTPLTFAATANVIEHVGARPVFADIDPATLNIDPSAVERAVTRRTRAVIPVHFGGLGCRMDALLDLAEQRGLPVVEDAAHAVGTRVGGRMAGSFGRAASFSFYANKNLTTAEGGMFTTGDEELARRVRTLSLHGLSGDAWMRFNTRRLSKSDVLMPGYKLNMPDLAASLGLRQLRKQERFLSTREAYAARYDEAFADLPLRPQPRHAAGSADRHSLHLYALQLGPGWRVHRDRVVEALLRENVGAAIHYRALHAHPFYREKYGYRPEDFPHAFEAGERLLSLPLTPAMGDEDVADVIRAVRKVAAAYAS